MATSFLLLFMPCKFYFSSHAHYLSNTRNHTPPLMTRHDTTPPFKSNTPAVRERACGGHETTAVNRRHKRVHVSLVGGSDLTTAQGCSQCWCRGGARGLWSENVREVAAGRQFVTRRGKAGRLRGRRRRLTVATRRISARVGTGW